MRIDGGSADVSIGVCIYVGCTEAEFDLSFSIN